MMCLVYAHAHGAGIDEACDDVARHFGMGYKAIRVQSGVPGLRRRLRHRQGSSALRTRRARPAFCEPLGPPKSICDHVPKFFARVREAFGDDLHLLHDCHHRLTPH